ncbi:MAG: ABC transporter permease [Burkholderiales bacterium]|jgi:ABC-2 type transport system permease protein|nr:ABC transporter permease [Burkholderiales bacterium]
MSHEPQRDDARRIRLMRIVALLGKESRQMMRDKSTVTLGVILPIVLLFIFGFGLSLDVREVPVAVVVENASPETRDLFTHLSLSKTFSPVVVRSPQDAETLLREGTVNAMVRHQDKTAGGDDAFQIVVNGRDSNLARISSRYLEGAITAWSAPQTQVFLSSLTDEPIGWAESETRVWYNDALLSRYFLIPGVTVLIMTLIGALLTALVVAREWERGTFEAIIATPVLPSEILIGKTLPYFALGMIGLILCLLASSFIFHVPMRGALGLVIGVSAVYLTVSLGIGLLISATLKNQFLASQSVLIVCFMPTLMWSGFVFDLKSAPMVAYYIAYLFPATWYVELLQTLLLAGNVPEIVVRDGIILMLYAVFFLALAKAKIKKSLE